MTVVSAMGEEIKVFLSENRPLFQSRSGKSGPAVLPLSFITSYWETSYNLRFWWKPPCTG